MMLRKLPLLFALVLFFSPTITLALPAQPVMYTPSCSSAGDRAILSWGYVSGATNYALRVDDPALNCSGPLISSPSNGGCVSGTDFTSTMTAASLGVNITPGTTYQWWVQAIDASGWSTYSKQPLSCAGSVPPPSPIPAQPAMNSPSCNAAGNQVTLSWGGVSGASYYALRVDDTAVNCSGPLTTNAGGFCSAGVEHVNDNAGNSKTLTIAPNTTYTWWVHDNSGRYCRLIGR